MCRVCRTHEQSPIDDQRVLMPCGRGMGQRERAHALRDKFFFKSQRFSLRRTLYCLDVTLKYGSKP